jgi:CCR4-NOT transcription complex subunit 2
MQMPPTPTQQMKKPKGIFGERFDDLDDDMGMREGGYFGQSIVSQRDKEAFSRLPGAMYGSTTGVGLGSSSVPSSQYPATMRSSQFPPRTFPSSGSSSNLAGIQTPLSSGPPGAPGSPAVSRNGFGMGSHGLLSQGFPSAPGQFGSVAGLGMGSTQRTGLGGLAVLSGIGGNGSSMPGGSKQSRPSHVPLGLGGSTNGLNSSLGLGSIYGSSRPSQGMMSPNFPMNEASSPSHPMTLNLSEFPALSQRGVSVSTASSFIPGGSTGFSSSSMPLPSRSSYAGFVTKPPEQPQEFQMHHEDFPALPGASRPTETAGSDSVISEANKLPFHVPSSLSSSFALADSRAPGAAIDIRDSVPRLPPVGGVIGQKPAGNKMPQSTGQQQAAQLSVLSQVNEPGAVSVPAGMVVDQFGMLGLLTFIRAAETDPDIVALALGSDLTTLGLDLNSQENLYSTFASPFAEAPLRPKDMGLLIFMAVHDVTHCY